MMAAAPTQRRWASSTAAVFLMMAAAVLLTAAAPSPSSSQPVPSPSPAAPGGGMDAACTNALLNMSDCLTFVEKGSAARRPDAACCPELAGLVGSNPVCLCELLAGAADSYGIAVDYGRALALPGICRVSTPPVSTCAALGYHVHLGPAAAPGSAVSPAAAEGPQFPGSAPSSSPPTKTSHAARRFSYSGLITTSTTLAAAVLPLAVAAIGGMV